MSPLSELFCLNYSLNYLYNTWNGNFHVKTFRLPFVADQIKCFIQHQSSVLTDKTVRSAFFQEILWKNARDNSNSVFLKLGLPGTSHVLCTISSFLPLHLLKENSNISDFSKPLAMFVYPESSKKISRQ